MLAAAQAAALVALLTNPVWVAKTRLQLQRREPGGAPTPAGAQQRYSGLGDCLLRTAREEGLRGLYAGLGPSLALVSHGALQFGAYEALRARCAAADGTLPPHAAALCGAGAKLVASCCTYPIQVLRSRLQQAGGDAAMAAGGARGLPVRLRALLAAEGAQALYRGFAPHLLRVLPQSGLTLMVYERVRGALLRA
jgi:solute carrier family 25 folate transporter 32